jgi:hypothetical protein
MSASRTISRIMADPTAVSGIVVEPDVTGRIHVTAWAREGHPIASPQKMYAYARYQLRRPVRVATGGQYGDTVRFVTSVYVGTPR